MIQLFSRKLCSVEVLVNIVLIIRMKYSTVSQLHFWGLKFVAW